jgi:ADP-heptose:LPS heptosyltransferase/glycosyltransferase involved in cell wall biosynthesis
MILAPAGDSQKVPNTPYVQDPQSGLWWQPHPVVTEGHWSEEGFMESYRQLPASELAACRDLANSLWVNWMKKKPGPTLDVFATHTGMGFALNELTKVPAETIRESAVEKMTSWVKQSNQYSLVTCVHGFQKIPAQYAGVILENLREALRPDGILFLRMPDREVPGFERDLIPERFKTAQCFWSLTAFLELLSQYPVFTIAETYPMGQGQRDYLLRPIQRKPRVCIGMIAKNEERDLPRCLKSLEGVADGLVLIDTGSTDKTMEIAQEWADAQKFKKGSVQIRQYLKASEQDESGEWKLWDFSKARNQFVEAIERMGFDYVLWMDADDELKTKRLKNLCFLDQYPVQAVAINSGSLRWPHHRLWKTNLGIRFSGRCHEYPHFGGQRDYYHTDLEIFHDAAPTVGIENSNPRNLRILAREFKEAPTPRCAFYLANTYKDCGRWEEAAVAYRKRMEYGHGFLDEYHFAALYLGRVLRAAGKVDEARQVLLKAGSERPDWAEFWMELAYLEDKAGSNDKAIGYALLAKDLPVAPTQLFRERNAYSDQPYRVISWGHEKRGEVELALKYAILAREKIGAPDKDWEDRIERLTGILQQLKSVTQEVRTTLSQSIAGKEMAGFSRKPQKKIEQIVLHRPGAIGDVIMTLNGIPALKRKHPGAKIIYRTHPTTMNHLEALMLAAGVDQVLATDKNYPVPDEEINLIGYPVRAEGYPEKPMKKHLIEYFAAEMGVEPDFDSFVIPVPREPLGVVPDLDIFRKNYITIHPQAGWSMYKNWPIERWQKVCADLKQELEVEIFQLGGPVDSRIPGVDHSLLGASFDANLTVLALAKMHLGVDSWTNHATNIQWGAKGRTRAAILWGSTQPSAAGYTTNVNLSVGLPCQPCFREDPKISQASRGVCPNPSGQTYENPKHACMDQLSVERVLNEALNLWRSL